MNFAASEKLPTQGMDKKLTPIAELEAIANRIRIRVVKSIAWSGVGHAGGAASIAEILAVLYGREMRYDPKNPEWPDRDRFVLSKGHGCPALYAMFAEIGLIPEELLKTLHRIDSPLQMHPELGLCPGIEISTGPLGQGFSVAMGMALGARLKGKDFRVYVVLGDGEAAEGQVWEAAMFGPHQHLDNLVGILDYNKFCLTDRVQKVMSLEPLYEKWIAFGWHVIEINGHSVSQIINALDEARGVKTKPTMIIAHTVKGRGLSFVEDKAESHSVSFSEAQVVSTLRELGCPPAEIESTVAYMKESH
jgi:transketolase